MKFKPSFLFYILSLISMVFIFLTNHLTSDYNVHDTYFVLTYFHYLAAITILALLTGLIYSMMDYLKKPIVLRTAILHFVLITIGLVFSVNLYGLIMIITLSGVPDTTAFSFDNGFLIRVLSGPILLLAGTFVFLFGIVKAIRKTNAN